MIYSKNHKENIGLYVFLVAMVFVVGCFIHSLFYSNNSYSESHISYELEIFGHNLDIVEYPFLMSSGKFVIAVSNSSETALDSFVIDSDIVTGSFIDVPSVVDPIISRSIDSISSDNYLFTPISNKGYICSILYFDSGKDISLSCALSL